MKHNKRRRELRAFYDKKKRVTKKRYIIRLLQEKELRICDFSGIS